MARTGITLPSKMFQSLVLCIVGRGINKEWIGKDVEGSGTGPV